MIRFMGEDSVDVPLWDEHGLMFSNREQFEQGLGLLLSPDLISDIVAWARAWPIESGEPAHDAQAARLVRRIRRELGSNPGLVYCP